MKRLRHIVTKAVVAKGRKRVECVETLCPPNVPTSILGCWVINHQYQAKKVGQYVEVSGKFDINVWYAYNQHSKTAVYTETITYRDKIKLHYRDDKVKDNGEVHAHVLQQPNCVEAIIVDGDKFRVTIEREFLVELIGETTVCIHVHPLDFEDEWEFAESSSHHHHQETKLHEKEASSSHVHHLSESSSFK